MHARSTAGMAALALAQRAPGPWHLRCLGHQPAPARQQLAQRCGAALGLAQLGVALGHGGGQLGQSPAEALLQGLQPRGGWVGWVGG